MEDCEEAAYPGIARSDLTSVCLRPYQARDGAHETTWPRVARLPREVVAVSVEENMRLMQTLDDAWNAQDCETFGQRHAEHTAVYWPGQPETVAPSSAGGAPSGSSPRSSGRGRRNRAAGSTTAPQISAATTAMSRTERPGT